MIQAVPGATDLPVSGHAASAVGRSRRYSGMTASQRWGSRGTYVRGRAWKIQSLRSRTGQDG